MACGKGGKKSGGKKGNRQYIHKTHTTMKKGNYTDIQGVKEGGLIFNEKIS